MDLNIDGLAEKVLIAIAARGHMAPSWIVDKRREVGTKSRLEVLRWACCSLDRENMAIAAQAIGVRPCDLEATAKVLRAI